MKNFDYEAEMAKMQEYIQEIENPDTQLARSLSLYREAMELAEKIAKNLKQVEGEILLLKEEAQGLIYEPLEVEDELEF